jgi:hypothetical protein
MTRRASSSRRLRRSGLAVFVLTGALAAGGCDPCSGVQACHGDSRVSYLGQLAVQRIEVPLGGIAIEFMRVDGVRLSSDTLTVVTSAGGWFELSVPAESPGEMVADFVIHAPPPLQPYRVKGVRLRTSEGRGQARLLGPWYLDPNVTYLGELFFRSGGQPTAGAMVTVRHTGGIEVTPAEFMATANEHGRFWMAPTPASMGEFTASLEVRIPGRDRTMIVPEVRMSTTQRADEVRIVRLGVGAQLYYYGVLQSAATGKPVGGVEVEFRQTAGPLLSADPYVVESLPNGVFLLRPALRDPLDVGMVVGDLTFRPPSPGAPLTSEGVRLQTYEDDIERSVGIWLVGEP